MDNEGPNELLSRRHQMFPRLGEADIARMRRFGTLERFADGEHLGTAGRPGRGVFVTSALVKDEGTL